MVVVIGELAGDIGAFTYEGLSPRMRGTLATKIQISSVDGIIPAYAGNTRDARGRIRPDGDHPRVCGEHLGLAIPPELERGSSPRMRGTPGKRPDPVHPDGIIPAYAGNTKGVRRAASYPRDHPRVCGEHRPYTSSPRYSLGSSPRMRGTLRRRPGQREGRGIIPAYAGNTCC